MGRQTGGPSRWHLDNHRQSRHALGQQLAQGVIDLAGLPLISQTLGQSLDQSVAAVSSLQQDGSAIELPSVDRTAPRRAWQNLREQQTLCRAIVKHAGGLVCCFKHCLDNMFVAQQASCAFNLHELSELGCDQLRPLEWIEDELVLIVPTNHPFAARENVQLSELRQQNFIWHKSASGIECLSRMNLAAGVESRH